MFNEAHDGGNAGIAGTNGHPAAAKESSSTHQQNRVKKANTNFSNT